MTEDIRDIHGPILHAAPVVWWPYVIAAVAVLAVVVIGFKLLRRRRVQSADQVALQQLEASRALIEQGDAHELSSRVSGTVRGYVETVFDIHAPRRTTEELLTDLLRVASPVAPYRGELGAFLELCDLAKYARWSLSASQMTDIVDRAESFIRATTETNKGPT